MSDHEDMRDSQAKATKLPRISVLLPPDEAIRFDAYCSERGYKKSTLIARLIREHLQREHFEVQAELFSKQKGTTGRK